MFHHFIVVYVFLIPEPPYAKRKCVTAHRGKKKGKTNCELWLGEYRMGDARVWGIAQNKIWSGYQQKEKQKKLTQIKWIEIKTSSLLEFAFFVSNLNQGENKNLIALREFGPKLMKMSHNSWKKQHQQRRRNASKIE